MGISIWQLLIILAIVLVLFGAKRLRNLGGDLGTAVKGFKDAVKEGDEQGSKEQLEDKAEDDSHTIEGESTREKDKV